MVIRPLPIHKLIFRQEEYSGQRALRQRLDKETEATGKKLHANRWLFGFAVGADIIRPPAQHIVAGQAGG